MLEQVKKPQHHRLNRRCKEGHRYNSVALTREHIKQQKKKSLAPIKPTVLVQSVDASMLGAGGASMLVAGGCPKSNV